MHRQISWRCTQSGGVQEEPLGEWEDPTVTVTGQHRKGWVIVATAV